MMVKKLSDEQRVFAAEAHKAYRKAYSERAVIAERERRSAKREVHRKRVEEERREMFRIVSEYIAA